MSNQVFKYTGNGKFILKESYNSTKSSKELFRNILKEADAPTGPPTSAPPTGAPTANVSDGEEFNISKENYDEFIKVVEKLTGKPAQELPGNIYNLSKLHVEKGNVFKISEFFDIAEFDKDSILSMTDKVIKNMKGEVAASPEVSGGVRSLKDNIKLILPNESPFLSILDSLKLDVPEDAKKLEEYLRIVVEWLDETAGITIEPGKFVDTKELGELIANSGTASKAEPAKPVIKPMAESKYFYPKKIKNITRHASLIPFKVRV